MGGYVALTIREENGREHRTSCWTNILPNLITNLRLLKNGSAYLKEEYLDEWYKLRKDCKKGKRASNILSMDDRSDYEAHPFLTPREYGLVVVDLMSKRIVHSQGYTDLGNMSSVLIKGDLEQLAEDKLGVRVRAAELLPLLPALLQGDPEYDCVRFREFFDAGRVTALEDVVKQKTIPLQDKPIEYALRQIVTSEYNLRVLLNLEPFTVTRYSDGKAHETRKMMQEIQGLGFQLSDQERQLWEEWIKDYCHQEDA